MAIDNCDFVFTSADRGYGSAIVAFSGGPGPHTIRSSRFEEACGECVRTSRCDVLVEDTSFRKGAVRFGFDRALGSVSLGSLTFRRCVAESTGWGWPSEGDALAVLSGGALLVDQCTFIDARCQQNLIASSNGEVHVNRSIFSNVDARNVFLCDGGSVSVLCSDVCAPTGVPFDGTCSPETSGVFDADPLYCDPAGGDFRLDGASPCLPSRSPCGELIGALEMGCGTVGLEPQSWGRIKGLYR